MEKCSKNAQIYYTKLLSNLNFQRKTITIITEELYVSF